MRECAHRIVINAPPAAVLDAFFDADALADCWQVTRAICVPRPFGSYAMEWAPRPGQAHTSDPLSGTLHGTVVEFTAGHEFFVADLYWHPSSGGDAIGPMALEATCQLEGTVAVLQVRQSGYDTTSASWTHYYNMMSARWPRWLEALKTHLEQRWAE